MAIELTTFGSMGWIPVRDRQTCCYTLQLEACGTLVIFDAGTGLARFAEPWGQAILNKYHTILLLLSHYHLDHVSGLIYLSHFFKDKKIHLAAPGQEIYHKSARQILESFIRPPFFGRTLDQWSLDIEIHDLGTQKQQIAGILVETIAQEHSDPSLGIKVAGSVCYITDTTCNEETVRFATGVPLLLHETWLDHADYQRLQHQVRETRIPSSILSSHSPVGSVAHIAVKANAGQLVLIHLNPSYGEDRFNAMAEYASEIFPHTRLACDGETIKA